MRATALAAGVITHSLLLYHPGILEGRAVTATAYRDADGMVLAAYGPSDLQVVCRTDGPHTPSCSLKRMCCLPIASRCLVLQDNVLAVTGCLCVWDLSCPAMPAKVLVSEGCPTACTFLAAPGRCDLILAGTHSHMSTCSSCQNAMHM